tara:strand:+ start:986 stop:1744 length:759 start_codon:yes stop_codon:yes gene_type:complete
MIDTHCHLYDKRLYPDLTQIVKNAEKSNITQMICIGDNLETSEKSIQIAEEYENIYASIGIHPHEAQNVSKNYLKKIQKNTSHHKVIGIGEIGLDYYYNFSDPKIQKKIFLEQLILAKDLEMPTIIHCRDAYKDLYDTIVKSKNNKGVIHCFSGSVDFAEKIINLGYYISFTGMITFVKELELVIEKIDLKYIMLETDAPYLAPVPYRGKTNQPAYVNKIAEKIAEIKNISIQEVDQITSKNARSLFNKLEN